MSVLTERGNTYRPEMTKCLLCDEAGVAVWHGANDIVICRKCAIESLPGLIADAVIGNDKSMLNGNTFPVSDAWEKATKIFWRSALLAAHEASPRVPELGERVPPKEIY